MRLSILICTLNRRRHYFDRLAARLNPQKTDNVEILASCDDGELSIGAKRNLLVSKAQGDYVCFVDDDDLVSENYVAKILEATQSNPDCIGLEGIITFNGNEPKKFIHSLRFKHWFERRGVYYRNPNHLNPIRRDIVLKEPFQEINQGEDSDFSKRVLPHLQSEQFVVGPIYFYEFRTTKEV